MPCCCSRLVSAITTVAIATTLFSVLREGEGVGVTRFFWAPRSYDLLRVGAGTRLNKRWVGTARKLVVSKLKALTASNPIAEIAGPQN